MRNSSKNPKLYAALKLANRLRMQSNLSKNMHIDVYGDTYFKILLVLGDSNFGDLENRNCRWNKPFYSTRV